MRNHVFSIPYVLFFLVRTNFFVFKCLQKTETNSTQRKNAWCKTRFISKQYMDVQWIWVWYGLIKIKSKHIELIHNRTQWSEHSSTTEKKARQKWTVSYGWKDLAGANKQEQLSTHMLTLIRQSYFTLRLNERIVLENVYKLSSVILLCHRRVIGTQNTYNSGPWYNRLT